MKKARHVSRKEGFIIHREGKKPISAWTPSVKVGLVWCPTDCVEYVEVKADDDNFKVDFKSQLAAKKLYRDTMYLN